jgi:phosphoribosylformylglycinamidine synthase
LAALPAKVLRRFKPTIAARGTDVPPSRTEQQKSVHLPQQDNCKEIAESLLQAPNLKARQWFFNRFDSTVGVNNLSTNFMSDTSVVQIKGTRHGLALSFGSMAFSIDPYPESVKLLVAETIRRTICSGGMPLVVTGCLTCNHNTLAKATEIRQHIAVTCEQLGVASSDVTVQCLSMEHAPSIRLSLGNIAFLEDKHQQMTISFKGKGDMIYLIGKTDDQLNASEYIRFYHNLKDTQPPAIDMKAEAKLLQTIHQAVSRKLVKSAHSVSRGGLFTTLLESSRVRNFGFDITVDSEIRKNAFLFGEASSRVVVSVATAREADFIDFMMERNAPFMTLGHVTREEIRIDDNSYGFISDYRQIYALLNN